MRVLRTIPEDNSTATDPSGIGTHTLAPPFSDSESNDEEEVWILHVHNVYKYMHTCKKRRYQRR